MRSNLPTEETLTATIVDELTKRSAKGVRLHALGTLATGLGLTGIVASLDNGVGDWQRLLPWLALMTGASGALHFCLTRRNQVPMKAATVDGTLLVAVFSGLLVGSVGWFDLAGLSHDGYAYAVCAATLAFCAGTLVTLNPLVVLIGATVIPAMLSLTAALLVAGKPVPALCGLVVLGIILKPLAEIRRTLDVLVRAQILAEHASTHDPLTGVLNRAGLEGALREGGTVLYGDLDGFKAINDRYGHAAGDRTLQQLAARMTTVADRHGAVVARLGGDEFAVVLNESSTGDANALITELLMVTSEPYEHGESLGLSLGISTVRGTGHLSVALAHADAALYEAKRNSRGQAVWYRNDSLDAAPSSTVAVSIIANANTIRSRTPRPKVIS